MRVMMNREEWAKFPDFPKEVPTILFSEEWAKVIHGQTLERLNERGGLHPTEMYINIHRMQFRFIDKLSTHEAIQFMNELLKGGE